MGIIELIEKYKAENAEIIRKRPDLQFNGDFSAEGCRLDANVAFIKDLSALAKTTHENSGLNIPVVSQQRELVFAFLRYHENKRITNLDSQKKRMIEDFFANTCG